MDKNDLANLLDRYRRGECTEEECLLIESLYLHTYQKNSVRNDTTAKKRDWQYVGRRLQLDSGKVFMPWLAAAASLLLILAVDGVYLSGACSPPPNPMVKRKKGVEGTSWII